MDRFIPSSTGTLSRYTQTLFSLTNSSAAIFKLHYLKFGH
jgi:hypothetical protein